MSSEVRDVESGAPAANSRKRPVAAKAASGNDMFTYGTGMLCDVSKGTQEPVSDTADDDASDSDQFLKKAGQQRLHDSASVLGVPKRIVCATIVLVGVLALVMMVMAHSMRRGFRLGLGGYSGPTVHDPSTREVAIARLAQRLDALQEPETRSSVNGELNTTITIGAKRFENGPIAFWTRAFDDSIPGPILRVKPGDVLNLHQINELGPNVEGKWSPNTYHNPNNTNVHFHGMHVDPTGIEDNVFRVLAPGESMDTQLHVPKHHPRGLFHYHPHYHGSVFLQMGGGMVGAFVVEDDPETMPAEYAAMKQHIVALQEFRFDGGLMSSLLDAAEASRSTLDMQPMYTQKAMLEERVRSLFPHVQIKQRPNKKVKLPENWESSDDNSDDNGLPPVSSYFALNGQYLPRIEVRPRENRLLRMIHAGGTAELVLSIPGCSMQLAASDGIYLSKPRPLHTLMVSPGGRVDVIINCEPNESDKSSDGSSHEALRPLQSVKNSALDGFLGKNTDVYRGILAFVHVQGESMEQAPISQLPPAPALYGDDASLMSLSTDDRAQMDSLPFVFEFSMDMPVRKDGFMYKQYTINHKLFDGTSVHTMVLGRVQEWVIVNRRYEDDTPAEKNHPFHLHTNAFQIVDMTHGHGIDYEIGDWRDTILVPTPGNVTIRFRPLDYTGVVAAHCHILGHSDAGMIAGVDMIAA